MVLGIDFLKDVDSFWVAKRSQVGSKIVPKIDPGGVLGVSWWVLGGSWGPRPNKAMRYQFFGAILGPSWRLDRRRGASWGCLKLDVKIDQKIDAFRDRVLIRFWWILGWKMEPRWQTKSIQKSIIFLMPLGIDFWMDFDWFRVPKWWQVATEIRWKTELILATKPKMLIKPIEF